MGEGRSFLGDALVKRDRLTGVPVTESECLLWWAGERHALESFSPRMRRPSLTGLNGIEVDCMLERALGKQLLGRGVVGHLGRKKDRKIHAAAGKRSLGFVVDVHEHGARQIRRELVMDEKTRKEVVRVECLLERKGELNKKRSRRWESRMVRGTLLALYRCTDLVTGSTRGRVEHAFTHIVYDTRY